MRRRPNSDSSNGAIICLADQFINDDRSRPGEQTVARHDIHRQFVGSRFMPCDRVELRNFFLGGGTGDDVQLSESDGSPESGLERFSPPRFRDRSSVDVGEGDTEALVGQSVG